MSDDSNTNNSNTNNDKAETTKKIEKGETEILKGDVSDSFIYEIADINSVLLDKFKCQPIIFGDVNKYIEKSEKKPARLNPAS